MVVNDFLLIKVVAPIIVYVYDPNVCLCVDNTSLTYISPLSFLEIRETPLHEVQEGNLIRYRVMLFIKLVIFFIYRNC